MYKHANLNRRIFHPIFLSRLNLLEKVHIVRCKMANSIKRNFSIKDKAFEGIQSSSEVTMVGRRMIPDELLDLLDDDCQVRLVDSQGKTIYAHLAVLPIKSGSKEHNILCVIPHHFSKSFPAVLARKHWELLVKN